MRTLLLFLILVTPLGARAADDFPVPLGWGANLENVGVQDVIAEFSLPKDMPADLAATTEAKFKAALTAKGLFAGKAASDFAVLTPSVLCRTPYGVKGDETTCIVELYFREHAPPPATRKSPGKRVAWGLVATYYGRHTTVFPPKWPVLEQALDGLLADFIREVTARHVPPKVKK